jgi:hypothetical protein
LRCWRAGLRIGEALDLGETDLDSSRGAVLVRRGKGGRRREVGMDRWAWSQVETWLARRRGFPVGALLCVIRGATCGRGWDQSSARKQLARTAARAGMRRRFAPHQLRHAHAVEMAHEGVPLVVIQRQLGHANLGVTSIYLQGIDSSEIIATVHARTAPVISATAGLHTMPWRDRGLASRELTAPVSAPSRPQLRQRPMSVDKRKRACAGRPDRPRGVVLLTGRQTVWTSTLRDRSALSVRARHVARRRLSNG